MGFLNNYTRPGKGISREEAERRSYFGIFGRKWSKFFIVNILYFLCNLVFFAAAAYLLLPLFVSSDEAMANEFLQYLSPILKGKQLLPVLPFVPFMFIGPTTAGLTYVMRNFARQEHAFVASDFWSQTKKNFWQGLFASIILTVVLYLYLTAAIFYLNSGINQSVALAILFILGCILLFTSFYVYPIMVTFDMKLFEIFKNAWLMSFIHFPQNLLTFIILAAVHILLLWYLPLIWAVLMAVFLIAWSSYTINFTAWSALEKFMMPRNTDN